MLGDDTNSNIISYVLLRIYFVNIEKVGISEKMLRDCYGHTVLDGEMFFTGKYLLKIR